MLDSKEYYIKAMGSTCYSRHGIEFPTDIPFNFEALVYVANCINIGWECQNGWANQPEVITFTCYPDNDGLDHLNYFLPEFGLIIKEKDWR